MSRGEATRQPVDQRFVTAGLPTGHPGRPTSALPPNLATAVRFACDPQAIVDAERAALRFVDQLGQITGEAPVFRAIVWRVTTAGTDASAIAPSLLRPPPTALGEPAVIDEGPWSGWFRHLARWTVALGTWSEMGRSSEGEDPFHAWVALWSTGAGLWEVHPDHIELFLPQDLDAPVWMGSFAASQLEPVPAALAEAVIAKEPESLAVLADWLADHDDPRAEPVLRAVQLRTGENTRTAYRAAVSTVRDALLQPFIDATPVGRDYVRENAGQFAIDDGFVSRMAVEPPFTAHLVALLDHPGAELVDTLRVTCRFPSEVGWPARSRVRSLQWWVASAVMEVVPPMEAFPHLERLELRTTSGSSMRIAHPTLRELRLEQPWDDVAPVVAPTLDTPALERLEWVTNRVFERGEPVWLWWRDFMAAPPAPLRALELRPAAVDRVEELVASALWTQLRDVQLSSVRGDMVRWLAGRVACFDHLDQLSFTTVARPVARALRVWAHRHGERLPRVQVRNVGVRARGTFG